MSSSTQPQIRPATVADVPKMAAIINHSAERGLMLHRSFAQLYENIRDFNVAVNECGEVTGVTGLSVIWADLAEIYAVAVDVNSRGQGLGKKLVLAAMAEAERLRIRKQMVLTYEKPFFEKLGFVVVDRMNLPMKVWSECLRCPKHQACDEIAMIHTFEAIPALNPPENPVETGAAGHSYEVPITVTIGKSVQPK